MVFDLTDYVRPSFSQAVQGLTDNFKLSFNATSQQWVCSVIAERLLVGKLQDTLGSLTDIFE
jgi:hypothetical protein